MNETKYQFMCKKCGNYIGTDMENLAKKKICAMCDMDERRAKISINKKETFEGEIVYQPPI